MHRPRPAGADEPGSRRHVHHRTTGAHPADTRHPLHRRLAARLILGLLVAGAMPVLAADDFTSQLKSVASIRFTGRHHVKARELLRSLRTRPPSPWPWADPSPFRPDFLVADTALIRAAYRDQGYLDARVDSVSVLPTRDVRRVRLVYHVREGELSRIRVVSFVGLVNCPEGEMRRRIYARPGRPFNPGYLVVDTALIARVCRDHGYNPHVEAVARRERPDSLRLQVIYSVVEGPQYHVGETRLSSPGEGRLPERLIRREVLLKRGDIFRISKVDETQQQLYDTGLFSQVRITPLPDSTNRLMEFDLSVQERKRHWVDAGAGSGTSERFRFTGEWGHRNLGNRGLQEVTTGQLSLDGKGRFLRSRGEASLLEPWAFRTRTRAQLTVYAERGTDRSDTLWVRRYDATGVSLQLRRNLALRTRLYLVQDNTFVGQSFTITNPRLIAGTADSLTLRLLDSLSREVTPRYSTHRISLGFERDVRDNPLNATLGSTQDVSLTLAGGPLHGGTFLFDRVQGSASWFGPVTGYHWTLALRGRAGVIQPFGRAPAFSPDLGLDGDVQRVPGDDRFRMGGVNSLRGYNENDIPPAGGLAMLLGNIELHVRLVGPLGLEAYVDAGNVWARPEYIRWEQLSPRVSRDPLDGGDVRWIVGLGPRLDLPFGPLRVDFSWSFRPELLTTGARDWRVATPQFAIGPSF